MVRFLLNNEPVELQVSNPNMTVLNYLREQQRKTGTKEGCAAGDCGACTVVVASPSDDGNSLNYTTINSCIALMSSLHGKQLITVEDLASLQAQHPVQTAMVKHNGSQCGFCTPGFVMSAFAFYHSDNAPERENVIDALSGNLCRCTGYRPIIDATIDACSNKTADKFDEQQATTLARLHALSREDVTEDSQLLMPETREALQKAIADNPDATLVAGSTDLALEITQKHQSFKTLISLSQMRCLQEVDVTESHIIIGAAVPLSRAMKTLVSHYPALKELFTRFASLPVRNQATMGGNVANASPIGDTPPLLLALNADIVADNGSDTRSIPATAFFTGYRQTALQSNEWISAIHIPLPQPDQYLAAYKVSKRMEDDISAVLAVFNVGISDGVITSVASGFGGVAATPVECTALAASLVGKPWRDAQTLTEGRNLLTHAFNPIDDVRATAAYRKQVLGNLWHRFWLENQQDNLIPTRVVHHA